MKEPTVASVACPDEERLEAYARRQLPAAEAELIEEHFVGCDACWRRLERILEVQAAFLAEEPASLSAPSARSARGFRRWPQALAAAALLLVALAAVWVWQLGGPRPAPPPLRGGGEGPLLELAVLETSGDEVEVSWVGVSGARLYRVELADEEGTVLLAHETEDLAERLVPPAGASRLRVLALDGLRQEMGASEWLELGAGSPGGGDRE